jgi:predicted amidohydrolase YtcJ
MSTSPARRRLACAIGLAAALGVSACGKKPADQAATAAVANAADSIFYGGDILTMEGDVPQYAEALAVKDGKIVLVGSKADVEGLKGADTVVTDLQGRTLLPGFIDSHSHFISSLGLDRQANCQPSPAGNANDVEGIIAAVQEVKARLGVGDGEILMGYGYDENAMPNGRLLNRDDLDQAFPDNPVIIVHVSMHGAVLNSRAMEKYGISADTETVEGGIIVRKPGTNEPYGLIMEMSYLPIFAALPKPTLEQQLEDLRAGQMIYAAAGVTTATEGATHLAELQMLERGAQEGRLFIDVISYPLFTEMDSLFAIRTPADFGKYTNRLKLGGIKITVDGSPQGRTALFTTPYLQGGPGGEKDWYGNASFSQDVANQLLKRIYDLGLQSSFHANGDGAIDMLLRAHEYAAAGDPGKDRRTVSVHSQFIRRDQLEKFVAYGIVPTFFTAHTFFFADAHISNRGPEQASFISPMKSAIAMGLRPTNHTDFNVVPIDQMFPVWSAVNRLSRNGVLIGGDERISPYQALQAMTVNAAYQYFEEDSKGSLGVGKLADLVILDRNPLKVDPLSIKDIKVVQTIKDGRTIYPAQ